MWIRRALALSREVDGRRAARAARLTPFGIDGECVVQVHNAAGQTATARTYPGLLQFRATLDAKGRVLVDGRPWADPEVLSAVRAVVGPGGQLVQDESIDCFDILPLLVATDGAIAAFGRDRRRLRPNIVVGGVDGLTEREWQGGRLFVGEVEIRDRQSPRPMRHDHVRPGYRRPRP